MAAPAIIAARMPRYGLPVFAVTMKPAQAPEIMQPSTPRLITPARSAIISPYVANITEVPARTAPVPTSCTKLNSAAHLPHVAPAGQHTEQHERHEDVHARSGQRGPDLQAIAADGN